ncbi:MAG TPA: hypothetical protein V6C72_14860, partial [Chroococcales cyanobacterium]
MAESADDLIRQVAQRYAQCTSYRDEGVVKGTNYSTAFKTYFQRNYKFRVEWLNEGDASASAVWFDGKAVYRSLVGGPAKRIGAILFFPVKMLDVPMAISFLSNQTQGSASLIPSLLIKSVTSRSVLKIGPYMLMDDQIVRDTLCYHIQ